jgi:hypothetical protein
MEHDMMVISSAVCRLGVVASRNTRISDAHRCGKHNPNRNPEGRIIIAPRPLHVPPGPQSAPQRPISDRSRHAQIIVPLTHTLNIYKFRFRVSIRVGSRCPAGSLPRPIRPNRRPTFQYSRRDPR